jgi:hypothetical protein
VIQIKENTRRPRIMHAKSRQPGGATMAMHKRILQWQADYPTITWIFWILVWALVFYLLFRPAIVGGA